MLSYHKIMVDVFLVNPAIVGAVWEGDQSQHQRHLLDIDVPYSPV